MAVIDVITFNGEYDLLEIRLNVLDKYVDQFIICEAPITFSGKPKPLYFELEKYPIDRFGRYDKWRHKIKYYVIDENDPELWEMALNSPNTKGAQHWKREFVHKESIKKALTHLQDDDVCFIGDCDEVWNPELYYLPKEVIKIELLVYTYYLNNRSSERFWGTIVGKYKDIKNECLNHLRSNNQIKSDWVGGWHFTSMKDGLKRKLEDSYTSDSYATPQVMASLDENIKNNKDFLGRGFTFIKDESEWPQYLKYNKEKYKYLCL